MKLPILENYNHKTDNHLNDLDFQDRDQTLFEFYIEFIQQFANDPEVSQDMLEIDEGLFDRIEEYGTEVMGYGTGGMDVDAITKALNYLLKAGKIVLDVNETATKLYIRQP